MFRSGEGVALSMHALCKADSLAALASRMAGMVSARVHHPPKMQQMIVIPIDSVRKRS